jgi:hypothetical protein
MFDVTLLQPIGAAPVVFLYTKSSFSPIGLARSIRELVVSPQVIMREEEEEEEHVSVSAPEAEADSAL